MRTFKVEYREVILHTFYVEAETEEDVEDEFCRMADNCELDFSGGDLIDGDIINIKEA